MVDLDFSGLSPWQRLRLISMVGGIGVAATAALTHGQTGSHMDLGPCGPNSVAVEKYKMLNVQAPAAEVKRRIEEMCRNGGQVVYRDRYQRLKARAGRQRGAKVAQVDLARRLAHAIWHMLTRNEPFAPAGAALCLAA